MAKVSYFNTIVVIITDKENATIVDTEKSRPHTHKSTES